MTLNSLLFNHEKSYDAKCLFLARLFDPKGKVCNFCGKENNFADDCGWFYIHPTVVLKGYVCEECFRSWPGKKHQERYGVGER